MKYQASTKKEINDLFPDRRMVMGAMGGAVFVDEKYEKFFVILDESDLAMILSPEDQETLNLVSFMEFNSEQERGVYLKEKGWL